MALSAARSTTRKLAQPVTGYDLPVKTSVTIYQGAIVVCNAGYAAPGTAAASLIAMGVAAETVANTGADGAVKCRVERGAFWMKNSRTSSLCGPSKFSARPHAVL